VIYFAVAVLREGTPARTALLEFYVERRDICEDCFVRILRREKGHLRGLLVRILRREKGHLRGLLEFYVERRGTCEDCLLEFYVERRGTCDAWWVACMLVSLLAGMGSLIQSLNEVQSQKQITVQV
jgi:hypothetical protein